MKTPLPVLQRLTSKKSRRRLTSRQRGVAIITVLAVMVLMAALVLSFFSLAKQEQVTSKNAAEINRAYSLRDTAINLVIAQIREATAPTVDGPTASRLWTSQPGMIRTFTQEGNNGALFKLYSARSMVADGGVTETALLAQDSLVGWKNDPAGWVDLNKPVFKRDIASSANATGNAEALGKAIYPIVDPDAYRPDRESSFDNPNVEGFKYSKSSRFDGVDPTTGKLPMPVRWLYVLQDGTIGALSSAGRFVATAGASTPSVLNPITGRIAFWTDDESCKININTASEGVYWDTPRCDTDEERFYANCIPTAGEYQRWPGHPAGVCLSTVLFPKKRFYASGPKGPGQGDFLPPTPPVDNTFMPMTKDEIRFIWDLAPFVSAKNTLGGDGGTVGGTATGSKLRRAEFGQTTVAIDASLSKNPNDHPYQSPDEMLYRGTKSVNAANPSLPRVPWTTVAAADKYTSPLTEEQFIQRIKRAAFMLTGKSTSPEINPFGFPKLSLWPLHRNVPTEAENQGASTVGQKWTLFDLMIAKSTQFSPNIYFYIVRETSTNRHGEYWQSGGAAINNNHNYDIYKYLTRIMDRKFPGVAGSGTFLDKYGFSDGTGNPEYSDRGNIALQMLDYMRSVNILDPALEARNRYGRFGQGNNQQYYPGQITAFCGCGGTSYHAQNWHLLDQPRPKGVGRTYTAMRVHFVIQKRTTTAYEMGMIVDGFCASQGFVGIQPFAGVSIGGADVTAPTSDTNSPIPDLTIVGSQPSGAKLTIASGGSTGSNSDLWPFQVPTWGGSQGSRPFAGNGGNHLIQFDQFSLTGPTNKLSFTSSQDWKKYLWRLMVFDQEGALRSVYELVQAFYFNFGRPYDQISFKLPTGNPVTKSLNDQLRDMYTPTPANPGFDPRKLGEGRATVHSLVFPFGDFRALSSRRILGPVPNTNPPSELSADASKPTGFTGFWSSFVPMADFGKDVQYACQMVDPLLGMFESTAGGGSVSPSLKPHPAFDPTNPGAAKLLPVTATFDYPMHFSKWRHHTDAKLRAIRGSFDPAITGDWATGIAGSPDGPYTNRPDEGDLRPFFSQQGGVRTTNSVPYFGLPPSQLNPASETGHLGEKTVNLPEGGGSAAAGPNRQVVSAGMFGSLATGSSTYSFWQNLLFRPDPFGGDPNATTAANNEWDNRHYGGTLNSKMPKDHLLMELFWMPIIEPYPLSSPFSTTGKVNMNCRIIPFDYIDRKTALHAVLKAEKMLSIPTDAANSYKTLPGQSGYDYSGPANSVSGKSQAKQFWRQHIHAEKTLHQFDRKFSQKGEFSNDRSKVFRTPSEICELWLVPESLKDAAGLGPEDNPYQTMRKYWIGVDVANAQAKSLGGNSVEGKRSAITDKPEGQRLTGDNVKETPYTNLYPRLCTRSNVFKVHFTVQTVLKSRSTDVDVFDPVLDAISSEHRGSAIIERTLDMTNPALLAIDYLKDTSVFQTNSNAALKKRVDYYYTYRISELRQFTP